MATLNVTVQSGGNPLEDVKIVAERNGNREISHTDSNGNASLTGLNNAQYNIRITKPYYTISTDTVSVSGTVSRSYSISRVSGSTLQTRTNSSGNATFTGVPEGTYYVFTEGGTYEEVVDREGHTNDGSSETYHIRKVKSRITITVTDSNGNDLDGAIVQLGSSIRVTDDTGLARFTVYDGDKRLTVSHPQYGIHSETLSITSSRSMEISLSDPDPDSDPPPNDATFIAHTSIGSGEGISVTVDEDIGRTGTYNNSDTITLSNGYNEIPLTLDGGDNRYRWTANFTSQSYDTSPFLYLGNIHIGITAIQGVVEVEGVNIPLYEPSRIPKPQLQFPTGQGILAARLKSPSSTDVMQVKVNGTVYGVET